MMTDPSMTDYRAIAFLSATEVISKLASAELTIALDLERTPGIKVYS